MTAVVDETRAVARKTMARLAVHPMRVRDIMEVGGSGFGKRWKDGNSFLLTARQRVHSENGSGLLCSLRAN